MRPLLKKWHSNAYRLYDKDIPELPYQIDCLNDQLWIIEKGLSADYLPEQLRSENQLLITECLCELFKTTEDHLWWQQRFGTEIENLNDDQQHKVQKIEVYEGKAKFILMLGTYRDTGLFLDHRPLRLFLAAQKPFGKVLNLFCYTSSFSVHLALNGSQTTNIDLSATYLEWSQQNFELNQVDINRHNFIRADILQWLNQPAQDFYDLIILDPPSFSNSKKMGKEFLDILRDHPFLIRACQQRLATNGILYFSTNLRSFRLDESIKNDPAWFCHDITEKTIPPDFHDKKIHQTFSFKKK